MLFSLLRRSVVLLLIAVVVGTTVISAFMPQRAYADGADGSFIQSTANSAVLDHQLYYMLTVCFGEQDIDKVTSTELQNWRIFHRSGEDQGATRGAMYDNETISCGNDEWAISEAFGRFGFTDPVKTFCSLDIAYNRDTGGLAKGGSAQDCIDGLNVGDYDAQGDRGKQLAAIEKLLKSTSKGEVAAGKLTDAQEYIRKYRTLVKGCDLTLQRQLTTEEVNSGDNPAAHDDQLFDVTVVNKDGSIEHWLGGAGSDNNSDTKVRLVGKATTGDYPWYEISCIQLEKDLKNGLADKYAAYLKSLSPEDLGDGVDQGGVDSGGDNASINATCGGVDGFVDGIKFFANPLNWLICPLITGMTALTRVLDNQIVGMLCINEQDVFTGISAAHSTCGKASNTANTTSAGYKSAWNVFRILSLGLLAIAALIMILSQTSGFEIVDAYTIRKTLPRILIAGIGITLSWALLQWFVGLTNDLGVGVRGLIYSPFEGAVGNGDVVLSGGGGAIAKLLGSAYLISLGAFGFLTLLATGALAVIIAFAVLTVRNMLVVLLLITAPIAIAAYVLPNTQNIWKTWWSFFSKALMVFPIITAFIAIGHVFAALATKQDDGIFSSLIGFAAYFAPYFLLPATFRFAGGAIATIGGFANDRGRGAFDMLKNQRKAIQADRYKRAVNGNLWDPNSYLNRKMAGNKYTKKFTPNELAGWAAAPHKAASWAARDANIPVLSRYGRRLKTSTHGAVLEQSQKWMEHVNKHGANDKFYSAVGGMYDGLSGGWDAENQRGKGVKQQLVDQGFAKWVDAGTDDQGRSVKRIQALRSLRTESDFHKMAGILEHSDSDSEQKAAFALKSNASYTGEMFRDEEMNYADTAVGAALGRAAHGFLTSRDSADNENIIMNQWGGDEDFAHAAAVQAQAIGGRSNPDNKAGYGTHYDEEAINPLTGKKGAYVTAYESDRAWAVLDTIKPGDYSQAKGNVLKKERMGGVFEDSLKLAAGDKATDQALRAKFKSFGMSDVPDSSGKSDIDKRIDAVKAAAPAVRDTLFSIGGQYSQADPTAKAMALKMMDQLSGGKQTLKGIRRDDQGRQVEYEYQGYAPGTIGAEFERYNRSSSDPFTRGEGGPPPEDSGAQGQGQGPQ